MSHIYKTVYNIRQNLKLEVFISPGGGGIGGSGITVQKFYPSRNSERFVYNTSPIIYETLPNVDNTILVFNDQQPPEFVQSLLYTNVQRGNLPVMGNVKYGVVPTILAAQYKQTQEKYFLEAFGLLTEPALYTNILSRIRYDSGSSRIHSINRNKQYIKYKYYMSGRVFKPYSAIDETLVANRGGSTASSVQLRGISYDSNESDVDYLNHDICITHTTINNKESSNFISNHIEIATTMESALIRDTLSTESVIDEYNTYIHYGASPLLKSNHRYTTIYGKSLIGADFKIIGLSMSGGDDISKIAIVSDGGGNSRIVDCTEYTYNVLTLAGIDFYVPLFVHKTRAETVISCSVPCSGTHATYNTFYPVTKGIGFWQDLLFLVSNLSQLNKEKLMQDTILDDNNIPSGYIKENGVLIKFSDYVIKEGSGSVALYDLTRKFNANFNTYMTQQSSTTMVPIGRNSSMRHVQSMRVSPLNTDQDSQSFQGGGLPPQTYILPTTIERLTLGNGNVPKNISLDHVVLSSSNDIINIAENFRYLSEQIGSVSVNFQGFANIGDLENIIGTSYIVDSITVDWANNGTSFECRAAIY